MPKEIGTSENKNLPAIHGLNYQDTIASELPALAAGLVHEVKNPLAAIHLHLQLLEGYMNEVEQPDLRDRMLDKVHLLKREILGLNRILQDFIKLVRPEQVRTEEDVDLNKLIKELVEFVEPQALREGIDLQFHPGELKESFRLDPTFVKQIVINLVINSIQAFQKSEIPFEKRKLLVSTGTRSPFTYIKVTDNGPGIPDSILEKVFDPFFSTKKEGSGLGLALVKKMIGEMGGHVDVRSTPGEGTEFTILLGLPARIGEEKEKAKEKSS